MSYLKISQSVIENISVLIEVDSSVHESILELSIGAMESELDNDKVESIINSLSNTSLNEIIKIIHAASDLYWEFAKGVIKNESHILVDVLNQVGLPDSLIPIVIKVYIDNKARISHLKSYFHTSYPRFKDLTWRIDIELAKRNMNVMTEPKFMLRLDLLSSSSSSAANAIQKINHSYNSSMTLASGSDTNRSMNISKNINDDSDNCTVITSSYHLQSDYANMKRLEVKLKEALDELDSIQSQRVLRYIS